MVTYYVVLGFQRGKKGVLLADQPRECKSQAQCEALALRLSESRAGVVAFSRTGSPEEGDWADAVVHAQYGLIPDELFEMAS